MKGPIQKGDAMSTEARRQPVPPEQPVNRPLNKPIEQLRAALEGSPWNYDFLAEYVGESQRCLQEEDVFQRLAFRGDGGSPGVFSQLYEPLSVEDKRELRQWWHEKIRGEAYRYDQLRARLSWRYFV